MFGLWPQEHSDLIKPLIDEGLSFTQIAETLNKLFRTSYTRNAVIGRTRRLGLVGRIENRSHPPVGTKAKKPRSRTYVIGTKAPRPPTPPVGWAERQCADLVPLNVALVDLGEGSCRFPYGDGPFIFCGHKTMEGGFHPYCEPHYYLCTQSPACRPELSKN